MADKSVTDVLAEVVTSAAEHAVKMQNLTCPPMELLQKKKASTIKLLYSVASTAL